MWYPERLTAGQLEQRRFAAARLLRRGRLTQAEIARELGVSPAAVSHWAQQLAAVGGPRPWRGARASSFDTERWTLRRIARVLRRAFGVAYHPRSLWALLHAHGWSPQHPVPRATERDEAATVVVPASTTARVSAYCSHRLRSRVPAIAVPVRS